MHFLYFKTFASTFAKKQQKIHFLQNWKITDQQKVEHDQCDQIGRNFATWEKIITD
jgi:hypothetical protein